MKNRIRGVLKWSERYTKTDMAYLAKGGFWLTLGQIFASGSGFILSIVFANLLPQNVYGTYRYVLSIAGMLSICTLPGVWTAVTQSVAKGYLGGIKIAQRMRMSYGALGSILCALGAGYYFLNSNLELAISLLIIGLFLPLTEPLNTYDAYLYGLKEFKTSTKYFLISQTVSTAVMLSTLIVTDNLFIVLFSYFVPWTITRFIFTKKTLLSIPSDSLVDSSVSTYGKHLTLMSVLSTVALHIDKILIFHYLGAIELAIYAFAIAMPEHLKAVLKGIHTLALPKFAASTIKEIRKTMYRKMATFGIVVIAGIAVYLALAPFIYKILFPEYLNSIKYSMVYAVSIIAVVTSLPMAALTAQKETSKLYQINIVTSIIQIVLLCTFTATFGLWGAIWSRIASRIINLFIQTYLFDRASRAPEVAKN